MNKLLTQRRSIRNVYSMRKVYFESNLQRNYSTSTVQVKSQQVVSEMTDFTRRIANRLVEGDRSALSKAITLIESKRYEDHVQSQALLAYLMKERKKEKESFRIGISGPPGAGKSTFIECLGQHFIQDGHRVAVLAVDPSSTRTGGSILGDKTRMNVLSKDPNAFVRPSPSQGFLGGVTANMFEIISLCEFAGYNRVLIETVGVGQSETQVAELTDMVCLLVPPSGGDELQGIKRGIVEVADLIIVNKADGKLIPVAKRSAREYQNALHLLSPKTLDDSLADSLNKNVEIWYPEVICCTSLSSINFEQALSDGEEARIYAVKNAKEKMEKYHAVQLANGQFLSRRRGQRKSWLWKQVSEDLITRLFHHSETLQKMVHDLQMQVTNGTLSPRLASEFILKEFVEEYSSTNQC